ncbi:CPBP family intramembrane glutamic endopeptidase [Bacteroides zoogleoformans]|uniref:CPBP family intramembrane glutamic endopeptidase n=1 Tax=Bacteroides zoogleoformans TaxID=28119 RepID=UPI00248EC992|nr:type II CAAX endopeptidase family protein [Bacteroides zoogleoformans]
MEVEEKVETPVTKSKRIRRAVIDIVCFSVLLVFIGSVVFLLSSFLNRLIPPQIAMNSTLLLIVEKTLTLGCVFLASWIVLHYSRKPLSVLGLSLRGRWKDWLAGMLFAITLYAVGFGASLSLGAVAVSGASFHFPSLSISLLYFLLVGITEELMMRGFVLGRMLDGGVNKFTALFVSSVLFSLLHLFNPNFEFLPFLNILLAGILLGASYIYTRNLCFPIALHWFWNWIQGPVLGYEVSGNKVQDSFLVLSLSGPNLINGGNFGFEGSLLCTILMIAGSALIIRYYSRK